MRSVVRSSLPPEIKESLDACWKEGVTAQIVSSIFDYYLIPYGLFLGASPQQIGFLVASPSFLSALAQILAVRAVSAAGSRRRLLMWAAAVQASMLVPLVFLPLVPLAWKIGALVALVSVFRVMGSIMGPAWGSLVSDYLPEGQRGQYMGWRSRLVSVAGLATLGGCGLVLYLSGRASRDMGFIVLFAAAAFFRFLSLRYMAGMADMPFSPAPASRTVAWPTLIRRTWRSNVVRFVVYAAGVTFATQLAAPYFSVYMLKDLRFSYVSYSAVQLASVAAGLAAYPMWGRHMDHVGTAKIMKSVSWLVPIVPFLWLFARTPAALVAVEAFSGFVWSGFTLASSNFLYDAVEPSVRVRALAYYNLINGAAIFLGAALGGWLAERMPPLFGHALLGLFLLSGLLRLAVHFVLSEQFKETRESIERVSAPRLFLSVLGLRPLGGEGTEPLVYPPLRPRRERNGAASR